MKRDTKAEEETDARSEVRRSEICPPRVRSKKRCHVERQRGQIHDADGAPRLSDADDADPLQSASSSSAPRAAAGDGVGRCIPRRVHASVPTRRRVRPGRGRHPFAAPTRPASRRAPHPRGKHIANAPSWGQSRSSSPARAADASRRACRPRAQSARGCGSWRRLQAPCSLKETTNVDPH